jgi:hypothetical protein
MHKNHLKKMFQLEGYVLDRVEYEESRILLHCHQQKKSMVHQMERIGRVNQERLRYLPHMMLEDKSVVLVITQRRFYFPHHKKRLWEPLPDVRRHKQTTNTFRLNTLRELKRDNYKGTGEKRKKSGMFAIRLLDELPIQLRWRVGVTRIGLDGKSAQGHKMIHNITDLEENRVMGVLPNLNQEAFKKNCWRYQKKTA